MRVDVLTLLTGIAIVFAAHVAKGLTGFGGALIATPLLLLFLDPRTAVPTLRLLGLVSAVVMVISLREKVDLKRIWPLVVAGVVFAPAGTWLLAVMDGDTIKIIIGPIIVFFSLAFLLGFRRPIAYEKLGFMVTGLLSGFLGGWIGIGGPPVVLFLSNQEVDKESFRANIAAYFFFSAVSGTVSCGIAGLLTRSVLMHAAVYLPAALFGLWAGNRLVRYVRESAFRRWVLHMVVASGVMAMLSGLGML